MKVTKLEMAFVFVATVCLIGIGVLIWRGSTAGVKVSVRNGTMKPVKDLVVSFTGGSFSTATVPPDTTMGYVVNPSGESRVMVEYRFENALVKTNVEGYLEQNYRGFIDVVITTNGFPEIRKDVRLPY
jgi:hypothetical protein